MAARKSTKSATSAATVPTKTVTELYSEFKQAFLACKAQPSTSEKTFGALVSKTGRLAMAIVKTPAANVDEMLLKIRVTGWATVGVATLEDMDHWQPDKFNRGEEHYALVSLREDIQALLADRSMKNVQSLEADVCNLTYMADIVADVVTAPLSDKKNHEAITGRAEFYYIPDGQLDSMLFAVVHLKGMIDEFKNRWYAAAFAGRG